jgi:glyoxylase-like metal-dependent hydrolase (beta-lactamase superfamily II)/rhodanese-related sulfurtransferase
MLVRQLLDPVSSTYTYLLADPKTLEGVIIDPVFEQHARDAALVRELGIDLKYTLDTHCHADHITGAWLLKEATGAKIVLAKAVGAENVDVPVVDEDTIAFGGRSLTVRATPGHTDGCVTFVLDDESMAFTGDCLLIRGAGRTDFQQGDASRLYASIHDQIFSLPEDCLVCPAHDYAGRTMSSVGEERAHNPRVGGDANENDFVTYMNNLGLPHPNRIAEAVPANMRCGRPEVAPAAVADWGPVIRTYAGLPIIDPRWVSENRDAVHVLDVRVANEFDGELGHIEGAQMIPLGELAARVAEVPADKPVVTVCRSGARSGQATVMLRKAGRTDVANVAGGMLRWRALGL